jgi:hypothetical protein
MATSLRDIPGASGRPGRRRQRDAWDGLAESPRAAILFDPRASLGRTSLGSRRRSGLGDFHRRRRLSGFDRALVLAVVAVALFLGKGLWSATRVHLTSAGLDRRAALTYEAAGKLDVHIGVRPKSGLPSSKLVFDGRPVTDDVRTVSDGYRWTPGQLTAGTHRLVLTVPRPVLPASRFVWTIDVDATPPAIQTDRLLPAHRMDEPVHIAGRVLEAKGVRMTANGRPVVLDDRGRFTVDYARPPAGPIVLRTEDLAGYKVTREVFVPIKRPTVHGVHMSAISWRTKDLRQGVFDLIDAGKINTVELDLKDEGGEIGYDSKIPLARQIGSVKHYYDLKAAVDELHHRGVRVIGRVVAFRDPILATAAWAEGHRDWVVQRPDGSPHGAYGGFTNMASKAVQQYNLDIAAEGAQAGMDEILWDYIRRPESGPGETIADIVFPGMPSTDAAVKTGVADFLARSHELLRAKGVFQGASLFGIAAGDPLAVGQNVPLIAKHVDYIAPMVYPSLWTDQQYHVSNPVSDPYAIVSRSLEDFQTKSAGTGVHFTPWLQDFSLGATYGDTQVWQQIRGVEDQGIQDFLLWSPRVHYHAAKLPGHPAS